MRTLDPGRQLASLCTLLGVLCVGLGALLTVVFTLAGGPVWDDWILDSRGVKAQAKGVQAARPSRGSVDPRGNVSLRVEFTTPDGARHTGSVTVLGAEALASVRGAPVTIEYDPQQPSRHRALGRSASLFGLWVVVPLGCIPLGFVFVVLGFVVRAKLRPVALPARP